MSSGGAASSPSKCMSRYSYGSGNSSGDMYISRVLAELDQDPVHREQRAEGVAVGSLVGCEKQLVGLAQLRHDRLQLGCGDAHRPVSSSSSSLIRIAPVDRLVVDELERRGALEPQLVPDPRLEVAVGRRAGPPASARARLASPSTLTKTRAWRRSGLVSTAVTVTNPMRGSLRPSASRADRTSLTASFTRLMRSPATLVPHELIG